MSWPSDTERAPTGLRRARRPSPLLPEEAVLGQLLPAFEGSQPPGWLLDQKRTVLASWPR